MPKNYDCCPVGTTSSAASSSCARGLGFGIALRAPTSLVMRLVIRSGLVCGLCLLTLTAFGTFPADKAEAKDQSFTASARDNYRARLNENVVTIMAGSASGTDLAIVQDIA